MNREAYRILDLETTTQSFSSRRQFMQGNSVLVTSHLTLLRRHCRQAFGALLLEAFLKISTILVQRFAPWFTLWIWSPCR